MFLGTKKKKKKKKKKKFARSLLFLEEGNTTKGFDSGF